ncbi:acyltransferase family protein [Flavipsychrobacter stenotrophus]|nr:acyltransferase [Flavipsychrobacter stenotrophus]
MSTKNMSIKEFLVKDNNNLDFIRIICASLVIVGHSYRLNPNPGQRDIIELLTGFTYSGAIAVKIFFFISGLLVTDSLLKRQSIPVFVISRFFRMMPGLLFLLLITTFIVGPIATEYPLGDYFRNTGTYKYIISNFAFITNYTLPGVFRHNNLGQTVNGSLWSLRLEVRCYAFLLLAFFFIKSRKPIFNIMILLIFIDAVFHLKIIGRGENTEHSLLPLSFALGSFLAVNKEKIVLNNIVGVVLLLLTLIFWRTSFNEIIFITTTCYLVLLLCKNKYVKKIKIKHDISYGIYLWGFLIQQIIYDIARSQNIYLYMLESILLSALMGYISYVVVEKRFMEIGKKLSRRFDTRKKDISPAA